ncbi:MAG: acyl carrier protein [Planctomycetota bacterium]
MTDPVPELRAFLQRYAAAADVGAEQDLFATGVVDSLQLIELMVFIERTFAIKVRADELDRDRFRTLAATARFIAAKRGEGA